MATQDSSTSPAGKQSEQANDVAASRGGRLDDTTAQQDNVATKKKKRVRNWTADGRLAHRAFERSRREAFKERLTVLASLIPSLENTDPNRLSKHVILDESISLHRSQQQRLSTALEQVEALLAERQEILAELNKWRAGTGLDVPQPRPLPQLPGEIDDVEVGASLNNQGGVQGLGDLGLGGFGESPTSFDGQNSGGEQVPFAMLDPGQPGVEIGPMDPGPELAPPDAAWDALAFQDPMQSAEEMRPDGTGLPLEHDTQNPPGPVFAPALSQMHERDFGHDSMVFGPGNMVMVYDLGSLDDPRGRNV